MFNVYIEIIDDIIDHTDTTNTRLVRETQHIKVLNYKSGACCTYVLATRSLSLFGLHISLIDYHPLLQKKPGSGGLFGLYSVLVFFELNPGNFSKCCTYNLTNHNKIFRYQWSKKLEFD